MDTVLLSVHHKGNRRLLREWLESRCAVIETDVLHGLDQPFDLCIVDAVALSQSEADILAHKEKQAPLFTPVLLIVQRKDVGLATRNLWKTVDELVLSPIEKIELQARVHNLLLARRLSLDLKEKDEELLQRSEQRYRSLVETIPGVVYIADLQAPDESLFISPQVEGLLGIPYREWQSDPKLWSKRLYPEDRERVLSANARCRATGESFHEKYRLLDRENRVVWVEDQAATLPDETGAPRWLQGAWIDITARKRAEEAIAERERQLSTLINNLPGAVFRVRNDPNYTTEYVSDQIAELTGYPADDFRENRRNFGELMHPDDREWAWNETQKALGEHRPYELTYRFIDAQGREKWNWERGRGVFDANGELQAVEGFVQDITERKQAEEALRQSEERYRLLFEQMDEGYCVIEMLYAPDGKAIDYRFVEVNPAFEKQTGLKDALGKTIREIVPHHDEHWFEIYGKVARTGESIRFENPALAMQRYYDVFAFRIGEEGSRRVGVIFNDITARKRAEEELRLSEERFLKAFHASPAGITITRIADGKFIDANESFCRMFEFTREEVVGHTSTDLNMWTAEERKRLIQAQVETGGLQDFELQARAKSGRAVNILFSSKPMELAGEACHVTTMIDITERKQAEEALQKSEERLKHVLANAPDAIYTLDFSIGKATFLNREEFCGYSNAELEAPGSIIGAVHPDDLGVLKENWTQIMEGKNMEPISYRLRKKDGTWAWIDQRVRLLAHKPDGKPKEILVSLSDITERKQAEEELRLSRDRLSELSKKLVEAREAEARAIGRELHDQVGQMLTALKLTLEIAPQLPSETAAKKYAQAQELLDDLMNRVSALSLELRPPMLDDLGLIPALLWHVNRYQAQSGIEVEFTHSGMENRRFDFEVETTVYRVVQESLTNVARHAHAVRARLDVRAGSEAIEVRIEDDGAGFDPQAALAKNRGLGGMRERVRLLGGSFEIESQIGKGTKKFFRLPLKEEHT